MTDDQWLRAIVKYRSEDRMHFSPDGVTGGARQLAQVLECIESGRIRTRFARLSLKFPRGHESSLSGDDARWLEETP